MTDAAHEEPRPWLRELASRLVRQWSAACCFGFIIEALPEAIEDADADEGGTERVHHPAHFLVAVWEPVDAPPLPQLPDAAAIVAGTIANASAELLRLVGPTAPILMLHQDDVNAALVAEMILTGDRHLIPRYRAGLEQFVSAENLRWRERIRREYTDRDEGFERFKASLLRGGPTA